MSSGLKNDNYAELERKEDKYIIKLSDMEEIRTEIEKHLPPAYLDPKAKYVLIGTTYLDSKLRDFFRLHVYGAEVRKKARYRKYGTNGKWDEDAVFLEIKEKQHDDIHKSRIELDEKNLSNVQNGRQIDLTDELEAKNSPLYTYGDLKRFVSRYNKLVQTMGIKPVLSVTYKRLAFGKGDLRITIDTNLSYQPVGVLSLTDAHKVKKAVDWSKVKEYKQKYEADKNAILEIKHDEENLPVWLQNLLNKYDLKSEKFSKYIWASYNNINIMEKPI